MGSNEFGQCGMKEEKENILDINLVKGFNTYNPKLLLRDENIISICCGYNHSFILSSKKKIKNIYLKNKKFFL